MAAAVDLARLRDQTLQSTQDDDPVTVNTRALVDKILARYSGEWTTLRELIQNAADATATTVKIRFETQPSATVPAPQSKDAAEQLKHTFLHHTVRSLLVSNNGLPFSPSDWARLKRIAEGNPDETKIGAFGVGFYSVFSDCENPFITSGRESMAFYWKKDSLFTRKGTLPADHPNTETAFMLESRNTTSPLPSMISLCQFLSTSITFIAIENIELWVDDYNLFTLRKKSAPSVSQTIPKSIDPKTKEGLMRVVGLDSQNSQIDATWVNIVGWTPSATEKNGSQSADSEGFAPPGFRSFFSRLAAGASQNNAAAKKAAKDEQQLQQAIVEDLMGISKATVFIRVNQVHIKTQVSANFATELERATKKLPPKQTKIAILTSSYDETNASLSTLTGAASKKAAEIITSILPSKSGRIFIGFPTAQTTGLGAHVSAPNLIPTVEREQVDLNARFVRTWNTELLSVAGIAARIAYSSALPPNAVAIKSGSTEPPAWLQSASFTLKQFTFRDSTPLSRIGQIIEDAFWSCSKAAIEIPSTRGILPSNQVRFASEDLSFVERIPLVPEDLMKDSSDFITKLRDFGLVTDITTSDIKSELEKQALTEGQLHEFLKWASQKSKKNELDAAALKSLLSVTVANLDSVEGTSSQTNLLELRSISSYINTSRIPAELPVPSFVMPFRFTKSVFQSELQSFGWVELQIVPWLRWLLERPANKTTSAEEDMTTSPAFSSLVLAAVSKNFDAMSQSSKTTISELLMSRTVIPTKMGMRKPPDSYFASVKLFDDLPTINGLNSVKEKFLKSLGVRKTVELAYIFERLLKPSSSSDGSQTGWSHVDLIKYFQSVWNDIPAEDIAQLQKTPLCPAEEFGKGSNQATKQRYKVSELFEPKDPLRALGLPVLQWPGHWNAYSPDGKILKQLGLRSYPSVPELVDVLVKANKAQNDALYEAGLKYFIENHYTHNYASFDFSQYQVPFLPLQNGESHQLVKPADCFADPKAEILLYPILREDLRTHAAKFGVKNAPQMADCALRLIKQPPQTQKEARRLFGYFADRASDISGPVIDKLSSALIVPIAAPRSDTTTRRLVSPNQCFLGDGHDYGEIFDYVDFGTEANLFLLKIGCKHEPSIAELAQLVIHEPKRILTTLKVEKYKSLLYKLHLNMATLKKNKILWKDMKSSAFLLAIKERPAESTSLSPVNGDDDTDDRLEPKAAVLETRLRKAEDVCIQDDLICYTIFKAHVFTAPMEELLEELYFSLGSPMLSSLVEEEARFGPKSGEQGAADMLKELVLERAQLFLHEQLSNSIRHDIKWLEKNLEVHIVQSISLRRTLRGQHVSDVEKRSAALKIDNKNKAVLSITAKYDVWQVSQCIVSLIMDRPKTQVSMVFETFLTTPLMKLRARGYNVDRILRKQKIEQARIHEAENQRRLQEEDRRRQQVESQPEVKSDSTPDQRRGLKAQLSTVNVEKTSPEEEKSRTPLLMPGAFQETPLRPKPSQNSLVQPERPTTPRSFFSSLTKHLGFDQQAAAALQTRGQNSLTTSPDMNYDPQQPHSQNDIEAATSPNRVMQNLKSAVTAGRAHGSDTLFSRPSTNLVKEMSSYCDTRPGHDLSLLGSTSTGLRIYAASTSPTSPTFVAQNAQGLEYFSTVILAAASVFPVAKDSLHLFLDEAGSTIAFNSSGSLFFNYRFFAQLHLAGMQDARARGEAVVYWWVTMCHELAHNLVGDHSAGHSYWTEQFVAGYFQKVMALVGRLEVATS